MMLVAGKTAKGCYEDLSSERQVYLDRARLVSKLTIPHLLPPDGYRGTGNTLPTPYQSIGARGISSLSSKLLLALFPPGQSFMRQQIDPALATQIQGAERIMGEIESSLSIIEKAVMTAIEADALRPHLHEVLKHLVLAGNVLLYVPPDDGKPKVFHLDRYVCKRDPAGNVMVIVTKECVAPTSLPEDVREQIKPDNQELKSNTVDVYTAIVRQDEKTYKVWQEIADTVIEGSTGTYKIDECPWIALRMEPISGESYAYGYAASLLGDLASLEGLMKALVESAAASAKTIFLVSPTSSTKPRQLNEAPNGSFVTGMEGDIVPLRVDKAADMGVAFQAIERLQQSLGFAFLLNQSVQRQGERVTAEEIRFLAQELEDVLAGTYAYLSQTLQLPLAKLYIKKLERKRQIPKVSQDERIRTTIITGLEALGRGHDLNRLNTFVQGSIAVLGDAAIQYLNVHEYMVRAATASSLDAKALVKSEEEIQAMNQAAQQQEMLASATPEMIRQAGGVVQQSMKGE